MKDNEKTALVTGACVNTGVAIVEKLARLTPTESPPCATTRER